MKQYDAIIIGFGKAGKTLAAELSNRGWQVAIVERSNMMYGGSCPNVACIPTKTLVHEAEVSALLYHDDFPKQTNMYKQAIGRKNRLTSFLRNDNYERLSKRPNVTIYTGTGSFISADTIKVELPEGEIELKGKEIFINTGSTPIIPAIDGIQQSQHVYTSSALLDLSVLPHHLIIIGGGYIGLEFASMYAGFGSKVTILEGGNKFMPREDRDIANSVKEVMDKKGIETMRQMYQAMRQADQEYDGSIVSASGMAGGDGEKLHAYNASGRSLAGEYMGLVMEKAVKMGESNACMKRIVAAPTAGACGVMPAVLVTYCREYGVDETNISKSIPFDIPSLLTPQDKFDIIIYMYKNFSIKTINTIYNIVPIIPEENFISYALVLTVS